MRILVIGTLQSEVTAAIAIAREHKASVFHAPDIESALNVLRSGKSVELALVDVRLPIGELVGKLSVERISVSIAAYGINADSKAAADAITAGAKEYVPFPPDRALIAAILEAAAEESTTVIYSSEAMKQAVALADQIAPSNAGVLITGESGTGKEVIARYIHKKSKRAHAPFIPVNCAAIPENLLESEMFGHEKGSFTGAAHRRIGKFEEASGGTLLLDEISEMDTRLQAKLLRAVQERVIDRVGGSNPVKVDIRILATSNRDLQKEVKEGRFREDLFFRLNVIHLHLPALRERAEDIDTFAKHFIKQYSTLNDTLPLPLTREALQKLKDYHWPGNVRELENALHRAVLFSIGKQAIAPDSIVLSSQTQATPSARGMIGRSMDSVEQELILGTLDHCLGNRSQAAKILGISIRTLRNKLNQYKIERKGAAGGAG